MDIYLHIVQYVESFLQAAWMRNSHSSILLLMEPYFNSGTFPSAVIVWPEMFIELPNDLYVHRVRDKYRWLLVSYEIYTWKMLPSGLTSSLAYGGQGLVTLWLSLTCATYISHFHTYPIDKCCQSSCCSTIPGVLLKVDHVSLVSCVRL